MATKKVKPKFPVDTSTEEKIKLAAKEVFHKKGFAATRTRDIAETAGINLALLNYYFRSKEKLFNIIMFESVTGFIQSLSQIFNDKQTTLDKKIEGLVSNYIDMLTENPDIPLFLLSEIRSKPQEIVAKLGLKEMVMKSFFMQQFMEAQKAGKIPPVSPLHFICNLMGMTVFPFVASPIIKGIGDISDKSFNELMAERKALIPIWVKAILKTK
jgi:AcrR family transcriptional regulator